MAIEEAPDNGTRTMKASEFKARCLALMDEVAESGAEIVITKRGKPVAKLAPAERGPTMLFGAGRRCSSARAVRCSASEIGAARSV